MNGMDREIPETDDSSGFRRRRLHGRLLLLLAIIGFASLVFGWIAREKIADSLIAGQLEGMGLPATYEIENISPSRQVLRNIVVGDPAGPDLTVERIELSIVPTFGFPRIAKATLVRPRIFGSFRSRKFSFGSLDRLLFDQDAQPPAGLPDLDLTLIDGRGMIASDYGPIGMKAEGRGNLKDGFSGIFAASAPQLNFPECDALEVALYGKVRSKSAQIGFVGPLRLASLTCGDKKPSVQNAVLALDIRADEKFEKFEGSTNMAISLLAYEDFVTRDIKSNSDFVWRDTGVKARYELSASNLLHPQLRLGHLEGGGSLRGSKTFDRFEWRADWRGQGLRPGRWLNRDMLAFQENSVGTFVSPMVGKIRRNLLSETRGSNFSFDTTVRRNGKETVFLLPHGRLRGSSGTNLLSLSRIQLSVGADELPRISGNFSTGGRGLPQITGRLERTNKGGGRLHLEMMEYRAGDSRAAIPDFHVAEKKGGALGFAGSITASGPIPGGSVEHLSVPVSGNWSTAAGLSIWRQCEQLRFAELTLAGFEFQRSGLTFCPSGGAAIVRRKSHGLSIGAVSHGLDLVGRIGESTMRLKSGPVRISQEAAGAKDVSLTIGDGVNRSSFELGALTAGFSGHPGGHFVETDVSLATVPLDLRNGRGKWEFSEGMLRIRDAAFKLEDREISDRFEPLAAHEGELTLDGNLIVAGAILREPTSNRAVAKVDVAHDLGTGTGHAVLAVEGLEFDDSLQPDTLTRLALGVVANTYGTVTGRGRINWNAEAITSSGRFSTDSLDFAAAFGPVSGVAGTVVFTDLLNLVTAPDQQLTIGAVNPGIEVNDGIFRFELRKGHVLAVRGAKWPFLGGTLRLRPVDMRIGLSEVRRYVLDIEGLDAAQFVQRMELGNISATGTFDGSLPLVFDEDGGRIDGGLLVSRPPGGNLSYVGELTYRDLSAMANFAFAALKSMDYRTMRLAMDGPLTGEIVTRVRFEGVSQGEDTKKNFLTRQVASLPLRFNVNIRAPFYNLITSVKSMYDPAFIRDPRELGLLDSEGSPVPQSQAVQPQASIVKREERSIQPSASENSP